MDKPPEWVRWAHEQALALTCGAPVIADRTAQQHVPLTPALLKSMGLKRKSAKRG